MTKIENPEQVANEIETEPTWLKEGEKAEIVWGEFEEIKSERTNRRTGEKYNTRDFKLTVQANGKKAFKMVNKFTFVDIINKFKEQGKPKTLVYRRPMSA